MKAKGEERWQATSARWVTKSHSSISSGPQAWMWEIHISPKTFLALREFCIPVGVQAEHNHRELSDQTEGRVVRFLRESPSLKVSKKHLPTKSNLWEDLFHQEKDP